MQGPHFTDVCLKNLNVFVLFEKFFGFENFQPVLTFIKSFIQIIVLILFKSKQNLNNL